MADLPVVGYLNEPPMCDPWFSTKPEVIAAGASAITYHVPAQAALQERDRITALIQIERDEARRVRDELLIKVERMTRERDQFADARNAAIERANFMHTMTREAQEIASAANEHAAAALREVEALRMDAERYRWLRAKIIRGPYTIAKVGTHELYPWCGDNPDAAIDAALKSSTTGKGQQV